MPKSSKSRLPSSSLLAVVTTARSDEESKRLLELLGMPFARS